MSTYSQAGVDIDAGDRAVELMKVHIAKATRPEVVGGIGGFAGLFDAIALKNMKKPLLATSTDGVGTKTEFARILGKYDTIGEDLVAMVVAAIKPSRETYPSESAPIDRRISSISSPAAINSALDAKSIP